jgi:xanthine dehydrogenase accessory factor
VRELNDVLARWRAEGESIAMATVIRVDGSAPRGEGAKMLVTRSGRIEGSVSGGCVEGAVADEAQSVLASGEAKTVRYGINKNMMWDVGLSCGGAIDVYIESLDRGRAPTFDEGVVLCTVVGGPDRRGERLRAAVGADDEWQLDGSLGSAAADAELLAAAENATKSGASRVRSIGGHELFLDPQVPESRLIIVGAVHIAVALSAFASRAGFSVTVVDPRERLNAAERFPDATSLVVEWPQDALPALRIDENSYVAVLTHDEKFDDPTLDYALRRRTRYVGAIGSKKTQAQRRRRLIDSGMPIEAIDRLHAPIGLDIGAETPEEIAIAILSEMIAAKYSHNGSPLKDRGDERIHSD